MGGGGVVMTKWAGRDKKEETVLKRVRLAAVRPSLNVVNMDR